MNKLFCDIAKNTISQSQFYFIITLFWPKFCVIIKQILCDYKNNHTLFIFVKFGVIIFIITQNFFYNHTKFWPIKCDYEIIHTKYWQILCDYSRSLKSLANLKKIARGDFLYKFWTFRRSRIITQYLVWIVS